MIYVPWTKRASGRNISTTPLVVSPRWVRLYAHRGEERTSPWTLELEAITFCTCCTIDYAHTVRVHRLLCTSWRQYRLYAFIFSTGYRPRGAGARSHISRHGAPLSARCSHVAHTEEPDGADGAASAALAVAAPAPTVCSTVPSACMMSPPTWSKAGKSAALEAAVPEAVAGRPVGPSLPWEHRASQSYQPRPEEARGPATGTAKGGGGTLTMLSPPSLQPMPRRPQS